MMMSHADREDLGAFVREQLRGMGSDEFLALRDAKDVSQQIAPAWTPSRKGKGRPYKLTWLGQPLRRMMPLRSYNRVMQDRRQGMAYGTAVTKELKRMEAEGISVTYDD